MSQNNEFHDVQKGLFLLMLAHTIAIVVRFVLGYIFVSIGSASSGAVASFVNMMATTLFFGLFGIGIAQCSMLRLC